MPTDDTNGLNESPRVAPEDLAATIHQVNSLDQLRAVLNTLPLRSSLVTPLDVVVTRQDGIDVVTINHRNPGYTLDEFADPNIDDDNAGC